MKPYEKKRKLLVAVNDYLQCIVDDTPEKAPFSETVKITYNGQRVNPGETELWKTVVRFQSRQTFADPVTGEAAFFGTATNEAVMGAVSKENPKNKPNGEFNLTPNEFNRGTVKWWFYTMRMKVENDLITEIEEITIPEHLVHFDVCPKELPFKNLEFEMIVPESERCSREEMIAVADTYWNGLQKSIEWNEVLVHPDCQRVEMGVLCTNASRNYHSVQSNFRSPTFLWAINERRYCVVDEERGVVICFVVFEQIKDNTPPGFIAAEAFKIECGLMKSIFAFFKPMCITSGWGEEKK